MKILITSAAILWLVSTAAFAGSMTAPEMEPAIEAVQEDGGSSGDLLIPLLLLIGIGLLIANNDDPVVG